MKPIRIGLLGLGVVGGGVWTVLAQNGGEIARRAGRRIEVAGIAVRDVAKARALVGPDVRVVTDGMALVRDPDIDIIVELMGGDTIARDCMLEAIRQGKHIVTANKALLAMHGNEIFAAAQAQGVMVAFEAAVAGGIPIIKAIREGLTANRIQWVAGIINGTTNFILSEMRQRGLPFDAVLAEAQRLGYAEADPTFDIEGVDAAHKLTLLASLAFGIPVQFDKATTEGISGLASEDIVHADRLGYRIKLLGITRRRHDGIELRVHPTLVPADCLLANVEGAMNAVLVRGDAVGLSMYYGQGAGSLPTASAVVADLVDVARLQMADPEHRVPHLAFQPESVVDIPVLPMAEVRSSFYLRLRVDDRPGVLADLARILSGAGISVGSMFQQPHGEHQADIIFLTHEAREGDVDDALRVMQAQPFVRSDVTRLRVENLA
ncbi:homoserine dehydrogenase [Castellaniella sp.]|uniref:homoserine dehydrogenase n=1 Tax=Castellaniella sp. TaxID=1955812 RepID=UPI002AFF1480|nr:homoserine dehydrogenase [Castellaniella sp.]